jgi:hypothetical protein
MGVAFTKIGDDIKLFPAVRHTLLSHYDVSVRRVARGLVTDPEARVVRACSVDATERCRLNFGGRGGEGFRYLPDGCKSLYDLIPEAQAHLTHWKLRALHGTFVSEPAMSTPFPVSRNANANLNADLNANQLQSCLA